MCAGRRYFRRADVRAQLERQEITGILTRTHSGEHEPFLVINMSERGIGIWTAAKLKRGESIKMAFAKPHRIILSCEVIWSRSAEETPGFNGGIKVTAAPERLERLLAAALDGEQQEQWPQAAEA